MTALPRDYDSDRERWRAHDSTWLRGGDVHRPVADRIVSEGLTPVLDVGGGTGELGRHLPAEWRLLMLDSSPCQLAEASGPRVLGAASLLPVDGSVIGAVTMLWMLYHLDDPLRAIVEAKRVLRPGGLFVACSASRTSDPELTDGYPPTTFDAEEAPDIIASVFGQVEVERLDAPLMFLPDDKAVVSFCRSHSLDPEAADRVDPPVWLTKRGCLVYARR